MAIGSLGDIVFEVSPDKVRTFRDLQIQRKANYTEHAIHGKKGLLEFTGFAAATGSLNIRLDAALGVNPKAEFDALLEIFTEHQAVPLILNGEPIGDGLWVIEGIDEGFEVVNNKGVAIALEVPLKLKEYVEAEGSGE
ncbi:MAG: phage tail protein [Fretibacterium sp.]|nr:phage tail protein [Fretibacterium sp.]